METKRLVPLSARYRAAERRILREYAAAEERDLAAQCFAESIDDLRRLGLHGPGLIIAAEHMAKGRLRLASSIG